MSGPLRLWIVYVLTEGSCPSPPFQSALAQYMRMHEHHAMNPADGHEITLARVMHMQEQHAMNPDAHDFEDNLWSTMTFVNSTSPTIFQQEPTGRQARLDQCHALDKVEKDNLTVTVHHGGVFFFGRSFSGAEEISIVRDGPVGIPPPHKPPPHKKPPHDPPKLPIPTSWPKPPHHPSEPHDPPPPPPPAMMDLSDDFKPKPPKDHPKPYKVNVSLSRHTEDDSQILACSFHIPFVGTGVTVFRLADGKVKPIVPGVDDAYLKGLSVKAALPTGFPASPVGLRAPIFPFRPVPAPPGRASLTITRVTSIVTLRLSALKNRIKGSMPCRGRKMRHVNLNHV